MGTPLGPKYILYSYMEPLGKSLFDFVGGKFDLRSGRRGFNSFTYEGITWTPKVCRIIACWAVLKGLGP